MRRVGLTATSCVFIPTYDTTNTALEGADKVNSPLKSVTVPCPVPLIWMEAPMIGSLETSKTTPFICVCAKAIPIPRKNRRKRILIFSFISDLI